MKNAHFFVRCVNCRWSWEWGDNFFQCENEMLDFLNNLHRDDQHGLNGSGCRACHLVISREKGGPKAVRTFFCIICNLTVLAGHICPLFNHKRPA